MPGKARHPSAREGVKVELPDAVAVLCGVDRPHEWTDAETLEVGEPGKEDPFLPGVIEQQFEGERLARRFTDQDAVSQDVTSLLQQPRRLLQALAQSAFDR